MVRPPKTYPQNDSKPSPKCKHSFFWPMGMSLSNPQALYAVLLLMMITIHTWNRAYLGAWCDL